MTDLDALKRLAEAAQAGPCDAVMEAGVRHRALAAVDYIAAASPDVVLGLIERVERLERRLKTKDLALRSQVRTSLAFAAAGNRRPAPIQCWMMTLAWVGLAGGLAGRCYRLGYWDGHDAEVYDAKAVRGQLECIWEDHQP